MKIEIKVDDTLLDSDYRVKSGSPGTFWASKKTALELVALDIREVLEKLKTMHRLEI